MSTCEQELCENWSGDGNVCPCAVFGIEKPTLHYVVDGEVFPACDAMVPFNETTVDTARVTCVDCQKELEGAEQFDEMVDEFWAEDEELTS